MELHEIPSVGQNNPWSTVNGHYKYTNTNRPLTVDVSLTLSLSSLLWRYVVREEEKENEKIHPDHGPRTLSKTTSFGNHP